jgi:hypothetical protein
MVSATNMKKKFLAGSWKVLSTKVLSAPSLWAVPKAGVIDADWHINAAALTEAWPHLVSSTLLC